MDAKITPLKPASEWNPTKLASIAQALAAREASRSGIEVYKEPESGNTMLSLSGAALLIDALNEAGYELVKL